MSQHDEEARDEDYLTRRIYDAIRLVFLQQASDANPVLTVQDLGRWSVTCRSFARKWKGENEVWFQLCQQRQWTDAESLAWLRPVVDQSSLESVDHSQQGTSFPPMSHRMHDVTHQSRGR